MIGPHFYYYMTFIQQYFVIVEDDLWRPFIAYFSIVLKFFVQKYPKSQLLLSQKHQLEMVDDTSARCGRDG
jgi:hypothetical protein